MNYSKQHLSEAIEIIEKIDDSIIEEMAQLLNEVKTQRGRLFFLVLEAVRVIVLMQ